MRTPKSFLIIPSLEEAGWTLRSAEERNLASPQTFEIPDLQARRTLRVGDAAQLLFDIDTREQGKMVDRGVDRMWVIVKSVTDGYLGVLDNHPGLAEGLDLAGGDLISFSPLHICAIEHPLREYVIATYGADFFS